MENNEFIIFENDAPALNTKRHIIKNNQIQLVGNKEALKYISYINLMLRCKDKLIPFKVDLFDYNSILKSYMWRAHQYKNLFYGETEVTISPYKKKRLLIHRLVLENHGIDLSGKLVDHINLDTTDNRFENLRIADFSLNIRNRKPANFPNRVSKYKGVSKERDWNKWKATVVLNGEQYYLGGFDSEKEAAIAYNQKVIELLGHDKVYLNKIEE